MFVAQKSAPVSAGNADMVCGTTSLATLSSPASASLAPTPPQSTWPSRRWSASGSLRAAALVLRYVALTLCSVVSGLSLIWALVCILRDMRRKDEQSAGAGLEIVQSDAGLGPHDQRVHASLLSRDVMLLRCSWLRSRPRGFVLPRRQDLPPEALLSPEEAAALFARQDRSVCALTYGCAPCSKPLPCPGASEPTRLSQIAR